MSIFHPRVAIAIAFSAIALTSEKAEALSFDFSVYDEPAYGLYGRTHLGGTLTGVLYGLQDNTFNQMPTAVEFTSDLTAFGIVNTTFSTSAPNNSAIGIISVQNGVVDFAAFLMNFQDSPLGFFQFRLGYEFQNHLISNGGNTPVVGIGNDDGFGGATYSLSAVTATTPIPAALPLFASALSGLGFLGWKRRKRRAA